MFCDVEAIWENSMDNSAEVKAVKDAAYALLRKNQAGISISVIPEGKHGDGGLYSRGYDTEEEARVALGVLHMLVPADNSHLWSYGVSQGEDKKYTAGVYAEDKYWCTPKLEKMGQDLATHGVNFPGSERFIERTAA